MNFIALAIAFPAFLRFLVLYIYYPSNIYLAATLSMNYTFSYIIIALILILAGVFDTFRGKTHAISSAVEGATMILRIDDVIASKKSSAPQGGAGGMGGGMPPGIFCKCPWNYLQCLCKGFYGKLLPSAHAVGI